MTDTVPGIDFYDDVTYEGWAIEDKYYLWLGKLRRRANENVWGFCTPVVLLPSLVPTLLFAEGASFPGLPRVNHS